MTSELGMRLSPWSLTDSESWALFNSVVLLAVESTFIVLSLSVNKGQTIAQQFL